MNEQVAQHNAELVRVLRGRGVDEIWAAMVELGILEEFLDAALETEKDDV